MIENKDVAITINSLMQNIQKDLNESIILVQEECSDAEFKLYRRAIATVIADLLLDVLNPIYKIHPDIIPEELK